MSVVAAPPRTFGSRCWVMSRVSCDRLIARNCGREVDLPAPESSALVQTERLVWKPSTLTSSCE